MNIKKQVDMSKLSLEHKVRYAIKRGLEEGFGEILNGYGSYGKHAFEAIFNNLKELVKREAIVGYVKHPSFTDTMKEAVSKPMDKDII